MIRAFVLIFRTEASSPTLYPSDYFEKHRSVYYDKLMFARSNNDLVQWIIFFVVAVIETCNNGIRTFENIQKLRIDVEGRRLPKLGKRMTKASVLLMNLYKHPNVTAKDVAGILRVTPKSANELIQNLVDLKVLVEQTGNRRNRVFSFEEYVALFSE